MFSNFVTVDDVYFSEDTKVLLRSNIDYLTSMAKTQVISDRSFLNAHKYDFSRVLRAHNIPIEMRWITCFLNKITDPSQDVSGMTTFLYVDQQVVDNLISKANTQRLS